MPDLIRHPDVVPTKVGNHLKDWVPVLPGTWIPAFAGMTILIEEAIYKQTLFRYLIRNYFQNPRARIQNRGFFILNPNCWIL